MLLLEAYCLLTKYFNQKRTSYSEKPNERNINIYALLCRTPKLLHKQYKSYSQKKKKNLQRHFLGIFTC